MSCTGPTWCMATGVATNTSTTFGFAIAEQWNGSAWSLAPTPASPGHADGLIGVSCTTPTNCMAVGASAENLDPGRAAPSGIAGAECQWSRAIRFRRAGVAGQCQVQRRRPARATPPGAGRTVERVRVDGEPRPRPGRLDRTGVPGRVVCGQRILHGNRIDVGTFLSPFAEEWSGGSWTQTPLPPPPSGDSSILEGISCISPTSCTSVGEAAFNEQADVWRDLRVHVLERQRVDADH